MKRSIRSFKTPDSEDYQACCWMTEKLKEACAWQVRYMLLALTKGRELEYVTVDMEKPGFPFAPHDTVVVSIGSTFAAGETVEEAECKMLGLLLRDAAGYPLFRHVLNEKGPGGNNESA